MSALALLRRLQLAVKPISRFLALERIGPVAFETLQRARPLATWWQSKGHPSAAMRAIAGLVELAHVMILIRPSAFVDSKNTAFHGKFLRGCRNLWRFGGWMAPQPVSSSAWRQRLQLACHAAGAQGALRWLGCQRVWHFAVQNQFGD